MRWSGNVAAEATTGRPREIALVQLSSNIKSGKAQQKGREQAGDPIPRLLSPLRILPLHRFSRLTHDLHKVMRNAGSPDKCSIYVEMGYKFADVG